VLKLTHGDRILVFTDGVTEASRLSAEEDFYGEDRLNRIFVDSCSLPDSEILPLILDDLEQFREGATFDDDITMILASVD